jgi:hypothetical protein
MNTVQIEDMLQLEHYFFIKLMNKKEMLFKHNGINLGKKLIVQKTLF